MSTLSILSLTVLTSLLTAPVLAEYRSRSQFQRFYPQYGDDFQYIIRNNCTDVLNDYIFGTRDNVTIHSEQGTRYRSQFIQPVLECILSNASEYIKWALSTAQIILGLTPTILAVLGASAEEGALLSVIGRRPLLAFLLSAASPSVFTSRAFEFEDLKAILKGKDGQYRPQSESGARTRATAGRSKWTRTAVVLVEYAVGLAAFVNIGFINYDLSLRTVCGVAPDLEFLPALWAVLVILIHGLGVFLLRLRARRTTEARDRPQTPTFGSWLRQVLYGGWKGPFLELWGLARQDGGRLYVEWFDERRLFIAGAWFISICTVAHIIFGTLTFSSMMFVGPEDAMQVLMRYIASALACRAVLMYELAALRNAYNEGLAYEADKDEHWQCKQTEDCDRCGGSRPRTAWKYPNAEAGAKGSVMELGLLSERERRVQGTKQPTVTVHRQVEPHWLQHNG